VFSRREREFLRLVAAAGGPGPGVDRRFPNPAYRRKLLWGIRRKTEAARADWQLYETAARVDGRVRGPTSAAPPGFVPVYSDPFATVYARVRASLRRRRDRAAERRVALRGAGP
jgi:hypothetical protein